MSFEIRGTATSTLCSTTCLLLLCDFHDLLVDSLQDAHLDLRLQHVHDLFEQKCLAHSLFLPIRAKRKRRSLLVKLRLGALLPSSAPQPAAKAQNASSPRLNEATLYKKPQTRGQASEKPASSSMPTSSKPSSMSGWTSSFPSGARSQYPRVKSKTQSTRKKLNHTTFHISSFHWLPTDI